jgi:hypothetical protein
VCIYTPGGNKKNNKDQITEQLNLFGYKGEATI